jgi:glycosyltransferase involved in cell wall biosynthesis
MSPIRRKTVALIDPLWIGHHPMYFSQFSASFLRCGADVIGLCPEPLAAMRDLVHAVDAETAADLTSRVFFHDLPAGKRSFFNGRFEGDPIRTFMRWKNAADQLAEAEALSGFKADLVYFPYLDSYMRFMPLATLPRLVMNRPWSGLYLRNHHHAEKSSAVKSLRMLAKGDDILRSKLCQSIGVLDERFIPEMEKLCEKTVTPYPDVTQVNLPAGPTGLARRIQQKAAGRSIIGIIGLERRKGFLTLLRTAALAREQGLPYYFACAGKIFVHEYTAAEQREIDALAGKISTAEIDNLHFDPSTGRIADEADYNSLFTTFDIAWAAYENFQGSSGTLSKAAAFEIPCIATAGECVGQRVEKYRIGLTIPEGDAAEALAAIPKLLAGVDRDGQPLAANFAAYRDHHSQARLDRILSGLLENV